MKLMKIAMFIFAFSHKFVKESDLNHKHVSNGRI